MKDSKFIFWQKWLTWANVLTIFVGIAVAFAGNSFIFGLHNDYSREVFFGGADFPEEVLKLKKLVVWNYWRNHSRFSCFNGNDFRKCF